MGGHRQPHAAAAGAQVQHPGPLPRRLGQQNGPLGQHLGVRAGDEHVPGDVQGQAVELPLPDDVGHRFPGQTPPGQLLHPVLHRLGGVEGQVPEELLPGLVGGKAHQLPGLQLGHLHPVGAQPLPGVQVQVVVGGRHRITPQM